MGWVDARQPATVSGWVAGWVGGGRHDEMWGVAAGSGGKKTKNEGEEVIGSIFGRDWKENKKFRA